MPNLKSAIDFKTLVIPDTTLTPLFKKVEKYGMLTKAPIAITSTSIPPSMIAILAKPFAIVLTPAPSIPITLLTPANATVTSAIGNIAFAKLERVLTP